VVVIPPGRQERRPVPEPLRQLEPEHPLVKRERTREIGHLEVDLTDGDARVDGSWSAGRHRDKL
jgi:hypothetical protein